MAPFLICYDTHPEDKSQTHSNSINSPSIGSDSNLNNTLTDHHAIWGYDDVAEIPIRLRKVNADTLTPQKLIDYVNRYRGRDNIKLTFAKISHDTIYININESKYLTQSIGTTGADDYISTTVYTLTELKGIANVNLNFEEGDHAKPGTYNRQYYVDRSKITNLHK